MSKPLCLSLSLPSLPPILLLLRHGESAANVRRLVVSQPATGILPAQGLTPRGRAQALLAVSDPLLTTTATATVIILASPFSRARETADIVAQVLATNVTIDARLSERGFGSLELGSADRYEEVWALDAERDVEGLKALGVETPDEVAARVLELVAECERRRSGGGGSESEEEVRFLLVSHGDTLDILIAAVRLGDPWRHREVGCLTNGEVRAL